MREREPSHEPIKVFTDEELVEIAVNHAAEAHRYIGHATARMIAAALHGGLSTALYSFASTGMIEKPSILHELSAKANLDDEQIQRWSHSLAEYVLLHGDRGPAEGWSKVWLKGSL